STASLSTHPLRDALPILPHAAVPETAASRYWTRAGPRCVALRRPRLRHAFTDALAASNDKKFSGEGGELSRKPSPRARDNRAQQTLSAHVCTHVTRTAHR